MRKVTFLMLLSLLTLLGCAVKSPMLSLYDTLLEKGLEGRMIKGKVFVEGDFSKLFDLPTSGAYGDFYLSRNYLLLRINPPFNKEIFFEWDEHKGPRVIFPSKAKMYYPKDEQFLMKDLPLYFLGLKVKSKDFYLNSFKVEYTFERGTLEGKVNTTLFSLAWRIKEIEEVSSPPKPIDTSGFKEKKIRVPF